MEPQAGGASDPKKRRLSKTPSRKIEVITVSDDEDDSSTIEWESSSSEEDVQILDQRIRNRKVARYYHHKDKAIHTRIFTNSSTRTSTGSSYARFKQGNSRSRIE